MKRASYREAIRWIAFNDEPDEIDLDFVKNMISVQLIAEIFGVDETKVAKDVLRSRLGNGGILETKTKNRADQK